MLANFIAFKAKIFTKAMGPVNFGYNNNLI